MTREIRARNRMGYDEFGTREDASWEHVSRSRVGHHNDWGNIKTKKREEIKTTHKNGVTS